MLLSQYSVIHVVVVVLLLGLQQIPHVAVKIFEYCDNAIRFDLGRANELNTSCFVALVIAPEIVGVQEQKHPPSSLHPDTRLLLPGRRFGKKKSRFICPWG